MVQALLQQIFVVDDEDDLYTIHQLLAEHSLSAIGTVLTEGEASLGALSQASTLPYLVLLDLTIPRMGGLEALEHIRSNQLYAGLPVIMMITSDNAENRSRSSAKSRPSSCQTFHRISIEPTHSTY